MLFGWKIEYLTVENKKAEVQSVVIVTNRYEFGEAERLLFLMRSGAKRVVSIVYLGEVANKNLLVDRDMAHVV